MFNKNLFEHRTRRSMRLLTFFRHVTRRAKSLENLTDPSKDSFGNVVRLRFVDLQQRK